MKLRYALLIVAVLAGGTAGGNRDDGGALPGDGGPDDAPVVMQLDGGVDSALPALPALTNVVAVEREDSVGIDFDPVDDAVASRRKATTEAASSLMTGTGTPGRPRSRITPRSAMST